MGNPGVKVEAITDKTRGRHLIGLHVEEAKKMDLGEGSPGNHSVAGPATKTLARNLAREGGFQRTSTDFGGLKTQANGNVQPFDNTRETPYSQLEVNTNARSSTGQSSGLLNRRLEVRVLPGVFVVLGDEWL